MTKFPQKYLRNIKPTKNKTYLQEKGVFARVDGIDVITLTRGLGMHFLLLKAVLLYFVVISGIKIV